MIDALMTWYRYNFIAGSLALLAGLAVIAPLLISKRTRQWGKRALDSDIEAIGMVVLVLVIVGFVIYNNVAR